VKIINDPIHGFIRVRFPRVLRAIAHPWVQRLRRLSQLGLAQMVYPNATHTRFAHALGAMHLMDTALQSLVAKGVIQLSEKTFEAALLAALLHDIGHGPFSHSLEGSILPYPHETITYALIDLLEVDLGDLSETRAILQGQHPLPYLCELIQSPLDVDRLDYLVRDSFFTGVQEGIVGTERLIHTLTITPDNHLAIEEKGLASVEKFILARRFMYWQVYLHKTVLAAEILLQKWYTLWVAQEGPLLLLDSLSENAPPSKELLMAFMELDDTTLWALIRAGAQHKHLPLRLLSKALLQRVLFKIHWGHPSPQDYHSWEAQIPSLLRPEAKNFWVEGKAYSSTYEPSPAHEIRLFTKKGEVLLLSEVAPWLVAAGPIEKTYWGYLSAASLESLLQSP
jgi:uncharacterized protein